MILIITSHPIQYQVPLWQKLTAAGVSLEVVFLTKHGLEESYDPGFGQRFKWDLDLLAGYKYSFAKVNDEPNVNSFLKVRLKQSIKSIIANKKVDAIWIQGWQLFAYWEIVLQAYFLKIPVWIRAEANDLAPVSKLKHCLKYVPMQLLFHGISKFLTIGKSNERFYLKWGVNRNKITFAPYCIDVEKFEKKVQSLKESKITIREKWNIDPSSFVFLFSGKFIDKKQPQIIIQAAKEISTKDIHILFVGDGALRGALLNEVKIEYLPPHFTESEQTTELNHIKASFAGFLNQSEISEAYVASDCLILPSDYGETWGLVVNEAYAHGIPAIVSNRCGCYSDLVEPLEPRFVFPYNDVNSLRAAMELAIQNKGSYLTAIDTINDKYNYSTIVSSITKLA